MPKDTQADLTQRARLAIAKAISPQRWAHLNAGEESSVLAEAERVLAAALQSEREAEREKVAAFMLRNSIATGHGDTTDDLLAELQGYWDKREAAAAEARRAAGQWHGHRYSEFQDQLLHKDMNKVTRARIEGQMLAHNESAKHFGALASPAPQEETR